MVARPRDQLLRRYLPEIVTPSKQHQGRIPAPSVVRSDDIAVMFSRTSTILNDAIVSDSASVTAPFSIKKLFLATPEISPLGPGEAPENRLSKIPCQRF